MIDFHRYNSSSGLRVDSGLMGVPGDRSSGSASSPTDEMNSVLPPTTKSSLSSSSSRTDGGFGTGKPATLAVNGMTGTQLLKPTQKTLVKEHFH